MNVVRNLVQSGRGRSLRTADDLAEVGLIESGDKAAIDAVAQHLPIAISPHLTGLIDTTDADDPIARQFVPDAREALFAPEELTDPIGDQTHAPVKGIIHRYPDRVLLTPVLTCPVYCRFCFRRTVVGDGMVSEAELDDAITYIRDHDEIWEVILSGGDPLILSPRRLGALIHRLDAIDHVGIIRIHTRVPVADPPRITDDLVAALKRETPVYVTIHCNHANELNAESGAAVARLADAGLPLLSQTVLLKGVNDDPKTMEALMRSLIRHRIKPYYLHHGDLARGTGHFRTDLAAGRALMKALRGRLSGIAQPTYVLDIPGGHGKVPVGHSYIEPAKNGEGWMVEDWQGQAHRYNDPMR
ncbi:MAG: lysine-2,3-aminomutase-like protein [Rhodospirillaceae bacterium]|jgi:lysine 2,3-aminomutase|nr:lysine-2,3-aminomutase-like protein [Rhodospirillaceae bacterium]MBT5455995.1 lysine-2,3-aminomutase-like protein [Rhodospirillaceae bacterium]